MSFTIRRMEERDLGRILAIAGALPTAPQWPQARYAEALLPQSAPGRVALVAEVGELVKGFAVAGVVVPEAELETIAVTAEAQGSGVGAGLLVGLMERVRVAGAREMMLEVRASNFGAGRLYARAGFVEVGRRGGYYRDPVEDALVFRKEL